MTNVGNIENVENLYNKLIKQDRSLCVIVYCLPKVGSTTLITSLRVSLGNKANVIHIHNENMIETLTGIKSISINELISYISTKVNKLYVIDIYRTSLERKISEYFDKLTLHFNNTEENLCNYNIQLLIDRFNRLFHCMQEGDYFFEKYSITNLRKPTAFDFVDKHLIYNERNLCFVKLRLCDAKEWATILSELFDKKIVIIDDHCSSNKRIGLKYDEFKKQYYLPSNFFEYISKDPQLSFYYNAAEKEAYLNTWKKKQGDYFQSYSQTEYNLYLSITLQNQCHDCVENDHYIDSGCYCKACSIKRCVLYNKALKGEIIKDKIIHSECVRELVENKKRAIQRRIINKYKNNSVIMKKGGYRVRSLIDIN
uniref:Uncharacterized protein n=1 Tax=viral metagenome TaxID=1070528 RepID=A0A6C0LKJ2_9ZZZZ